MLSTTSVAPPSVVIRGFERARPSRATRVQAARAAFSPLTSIDGEGPGSGRRHTPSELGQQINLNRAPGPHDRFQLLSAEEMYRKFPDWVHTSTPSAIEDREPAGLSALHISDGGPTTGRRR